MTKTASDPWSVLNIARDADDETIRQAWLQAVKLHPPEHSDGAFERIQEAYSLLRDERQRRCLQVLGRDFAGPLRDLMPRERTWVGPDVWLAVLEERP